MKATAEAPANIAFIKYWGKADEQLRLPLNDSLSMNLSGAFTQTTVEFSEHYTRDEVHIVDATFSPEETARVTAGLDVIRTRANCPFRARVVTKNTFPKGAGSAASASGFAALMTAGFAAANVSLSQKELTLFARLGSGSACRSIPSGFVVWEKGTSHETSYAYSLYDENYWDLCDLLVIVDKRMKKVATSDGMRNVTTSPYLSSRLLAVPARLKRATEALARKDFAALGSIIEEDCLDMHRVMQTQNPPLSYWSEVTQAIMTAVPVWRTKGIPVYFTIDAGPNVHLICEEKDISRVKAELTDISGIEEIIYNKVAKGARTISAHLF
ncbi:MAG: diphosphomevalonate decarboxylase [Patescibacteria group bacterium]